MEIKGIGNVEIVFYVGTHKVSAFAGQILKDGPRILSYQEIFQPEGFENGFVVNMEAAVSTLDIFVNQLLPQRGNREVTAYVVLGNSKLHGHHFASSQYYETPRSITTHEVKSIVEQTRSVATLPLTEFVLQVFPESFLVNDMADIHNPLGLEANRLGVGLKIFTMDFQEFKNVSRAFETADITVKGFFPRMLTVSEAVLTEQEKEEGVVLIDIADTMTELVLWKNGRLTRTKNVEKAGRTLTDKIAREWEIELHDAQKLKERFATLEPEADFGDELIPLVQRNGKTNQQIRRQDFQDKFTAASQEWLGAIFAEVDALAQEEKMMYPHYVFTGGGTAFNGFMEFVTHKFQREARMGVSRKLEAANEVLVDPSLTPALGMYRWLSAQQVNYEKLTAPKNVLEKTLASAKGWFYSYF
ncbi:MAG TPA: cell division FtsA domain-containing protein [Verrucomicrobiae bacterium]|jgi:cell division protein FtsA|nr:cell division FtsA domain-containing protein [Verrucomicrobiae bacterium]